MKGVSLTLIAIISFSFLSCASARTKQQKNFYQMLYSTGPLANTQPMFPKNLPQWEPNVFPIRLPSEVIPVWIAPYVSKSGNLVGAHYIYMVVKKERWWIQDNEGGPLKR